MLTPAYTKQFERDLKRLQKRGKNLIKIKMLIRSIIAEDPLDAIHRDHKLIGNWRGRRECHVESDWLLVYLLDTDRVVFERTGTHADLFQK